MNARKLVFLTPGENPERPPRGIAASVAWYLLGVLAAAFTFAGAVIFACLLPVAAAGLLVWIIILPVPRAVIRRHRRMRAPVRAWETSVKPEGTP